MTEIVVRALLPDDDRTDFTSGNPDLDRFFPKYAAQNQFRHHVGATYVAISDGVIVGFVTVSAATIHVEDIPDKQRKGLPQYPLPVLRLARLAFDRRVQRSGVGRQLLRAVFSLALEMSKHVGCVGVLVDSKPDAVEYYHEFGFEELEILEGALGDRPPPVPMFLPLAAIPDRANNE